MAISKKRNGFTTAGSVASRPRRMRVAQGPAPETAPIGSGMAREAAKKIEEKKTKTRDRAKDILKQIKRRRG